MTAGSERRLIIPANLGYGKQGQKGIPSNSELHFDVKLIGIN
jgi:FK506-binding nuclear protein